MWGQGQYQLVQYLILTVTVPLTVKLDLLISLQEVLLLPVTMLVPSTSYTCPHIVLAGPGTVTIGGNLTIGTFTAYAGSTTNFGGTVAIGTFTPSTGTFNYNGGAQTVLSATYQNLTLSGSGTKTISSVTVNGVLSMEGTATASAAPTYGSSATLQYNTATARTAGPEWITPFAATGGVIIENTGTITMNAAKSFQCRGSSHH